MGCRVLSFFQLDETALAFPLHLMGEVRCGVGMRFRLQPSWCLLVAVAAVAAVIAILVVVVAVTVVSSGSQEVARSRSGSGRQEW